MNEQIQLFVQQLSEAVQETPETIMTAILNGGEEGVKKIVEVLLKGDVQSAKALVLLLAGIRKAAHGAKLQYFKSLKHQCADDEEVVYYKKGGRVGCGCKKKEDGGEIPKASLGAVAKFKTEKMQNPSRPIRTKAQLREIDRKSLEAYERGYGDHNMNPNAQLKPTKSVSKKLDPRTTKTLPGGKYPTNWTSQDRQTWERLHGDNDEGAAVVKNKGIGKNCNGAAIKFKKSFKKGGSLNSIPFMQNGTPKKGSNKKY